MSDSHQSIVMPIIRLQRSMEVLAAVRAILARYYRNEDSTLEHRQAIEMFETANELDAVIDTASRYNQRASIWNSRHLHQPTPVVNPEH